MVDAIRQNQAAIEALCRAHGVRRLELIGSAAQDRFDPDRSDFDFLVQFETSTWVGSSDRYFGLLFGLEDLLKRKIDLVDRAAGLHPLFLQVAEQHRELLYEAGSPKAA
jgi:predicted nucleotidyltransferase